MRRGLYAAPRRCSRLSANVFSFGADVSSFWRNVFNFRADVFSFGVEVFTRPDGDALAGAMGSGWATGCNPCPWSAGAGVDALARAGWCIGWEGIPHFAALCSFGLPGRHACQSAHPRLLSAPGGGREAAQGGPVGLNAQAACALQCLVPAPDHVGPEHGLTLDAPTQLLTGFRRRRRNP